MVFQAALFDVFGTVVDWRSSVISFMESKAPKCESTSHVDWRLFAEDWRKGYQTHVQRPIQKRFINVDTAHREILCELVTKYDIKGWSKENLDT